MWPWGQLCTAGGGAPPRRASYQVAHSCCQITPLLAAGSSPFPRLFPLWLRQLLFLCSEASPRTPPPPSTHTPNPNRFSLCPNDGSSGYLP